MKILPILNHQLQDKNSKNKNPNFGMILKCKDDLFTKLYLNCEDENIKKLLSKKISKGRTTLYYLKKGIEILLENINSQNGKSFEENHIHFVIGKSRMEKLNQKNPTGDKIRELLKLPNNKEITKRDFIRVFYPDFDTKELDLTLKFEETPWFDDKPRIAFLVSRPDGNGYERSVPDIEHHFPGNISIDRLIEGGVDTGEDLIGAGVANAVGMSIKEHPLYKQMLDING